MSDEQPAVDPVVEPTATTSEVDEGKAFAILSYVISFVGLPFFLVPLIMRNNSFSLYHAKQCLLLWIFITVGSAIAGILTLVCVGALLIPILAIAWYVWNIIGLINAANGQQKPLPLFGQLADNWFKGINKV
ncbi:MAG: DUF4870 domain-containing protein [Verrucomicrobia bacterium]|nr:DUF4870 domain-containing protein [Verrucomicrobiota bacterium]